MRARDCHKCGSVSGVYYDLCDDCMTRLNVLVAENAKLKEQKARLRDALYFVLGWVRGRKGWERLVDVVLTALAQTEGGEGPDCEDHVWDRRGDE